MMIQITSLSFLETHIIVMSQNYIKKQGILNVILLMQLVIQSMLI